MSLDDYIRSLLLNRPPDVSRGPERPVDPSSPEPPPPIVPRDPRYRANPFFGLDRVIQSHFSSIFGPFFGSDGGTPSIDDDDPASFGSTGGGWSSPRIEIWSWQDTRDEFGEDDVPGSDWDGGGGVWGGGGGFGSGGFGGGGFGGGGFGGFPPEMDGNDNWNADEPEGLRGLFHGFDDILRNFRIPGDEQLEGRSRVDDFDQNDMIRPPRKSLRDYMLKGPIVGEDVDSDPPPSVPPPSADPATPYVESLPRRHESSREDLSLDHRSDFDKTAEIDRILREGDQSREFRDPRQQNPFRDPRQQNPFRDPRHPSPFRDHHDGFDRSFFGSLWGSFLPRNFSWNSSGGTSLERSWNYKYSTTTTNVTPDGSVETKKKQSDGEGNVVETIVRRRSGAQGSITTTTKSDGSVHVTRDGDQSLF